jgi:microcystin-dependent protein
LTVVNPADTSVWGASAAGRGADGTTDRQHEQGAVIYPVFTALEANQANELVSKYANAGSVVYQGSGTPGTFTELAVGTAAHVLKVNAGATAPEWGQVATAGIADSAITSAKILDGTIATTDIADSAITSAKIANGTIVEGDIADLAITVGKIANNSITLGKLASALVTYLVPVGTISAYAGATAPDGWLLCNGTNTTGYTALAALVGATTPDLRGHTLVGQSSYAPFNTDLLTKFGSTTSTASHGHAVTITNTPNGSTGVYGVGGGTSTANIRAVSSSGTSTQTVTSASFGDTHGNVQPSALVNYIIKY